LFTIYSSQLSSHQRPVHTLKSGHAFLEQWTLNLFKKILGMKKTFILSVLSITAVLMYSSKKAYTDETGRSGNSGAPGESTCSQSSCHGSGGGGLADNAGPGTIKLTSSNMPNWNYVPGQTYHLTVTVTDASKKGYGFSATALNTSNGSIGTLVVTDAAKTKTGAKTISGASRSYIEHKTPNLTKPGVFNFDWKAPATASGNITIYFTGVAANMDGSENGADNVYKGTQVVTVGNPSGLEEEIIAPSEIALFPNPAKSTIRIRLKNSVAPETQYTVYSIHGTKMIENLPYAPGAEVSVEGWSSGIYFVQMNIGGKSVTKQFIVE